MERAPFNVGEEVYDQHDDDPDTAIVTTTPEIPAEDWEIPHLERTVAEDNPDYPADAPIAFVLFEQQVDDHFSDWERDEPLTIDALLDAETTFYTFPHQRLEPLHPDDTEDEDAEANEASEGADEDKRENTSESASDSEEPEDKSDPEPPADVRALKDDLADRGMNVEIEPDNQTITAEKLGESYRLQPGEIIDGDDGRYREKLEQIVAEA
jgi:hypothetical protein